MKEYFYYKDLLGWEHFWAGGLYLMLHDIEDNILGIKPYTRIITSPNIRSMEFWDQAKEEKQLQKVEFDFFERKLNRAFEIINSQKQ